MPDRDIDFSGFDMQGAGGPTDVIAQVDRAIHPDGKNMVLLFEKQRGDPGTKPQRDHILSRMIMRGVLNKDLGLPADNGLDALGSHTVAEAINSIADNGRAREELLSGMEAAQTFRRRDNAVAGGGAGGDFAP